MWVPTWFEKSGRVAKDRSGLSKRYCAGFSYLRDSLDFMYRYRGPYTPLPTFLTNSPCTEASSLVGLTCPHFGIVKKQFHSTFKPSTRAPFSKQRTWLMETFSSFRRVKAEMSQNVPQSVAAPSLLPLHQQAHQGHSQGDPSGQQMISWGARMHDEPPGVSKSCAPAPPASVICFGAQRWG